MTAPIYDYDGESVAFVRRRNGAYLIQWAGSLADDATPDELIDCASSLAAAKRIAKQGAREFGYRKLRWSQEEPRPLLVLLGSSSETRDDEAGEY